MQQIPMSVAKKWLAVAWLIGFIVLFGFVLAQTVRNVYGEKWEQAWGWLFPSVLPTFSLIVSVLASDLRGQSRPDQNADKSFFIGSLIISVLYLLLVLSTILVKPFTNFGYIELMNKSHIWLGPIQGLVSAVIGAFFVKEQKRGRS